MSGNWSQDFLLGSVFIVCWLSWCSIKSPDFFMCLVIFNWVLSSTYENLLFSLQIRQISSGRKLDSLAISNCLNPVSGLKLGSDLMLINPFLIDLYQKVRVGEVDRLPSAKFIIDSQHKQWKPEDNWILFITNFLYM